MDWIMGVVVLLGALAVGYVYGLPVAGSLYRQARAASWKRRYHREIVSHLRGAIRVRL